MHMIATMMDSERKFIFLLPDCLLYGFISDPSLPAAQVAWQVPLTAFPG
jgi:hypothetical protein